jgi:hypothetical protein
MESVILDHSFVNIFCCKWTEADIIGRVPEEKKEEVLPAINAEVRLKMNTN